jgi:pimeloyl-ACP methyl ester carboxylesterase
MPIARIGELELDYERSGAGPPLLLIMGMSGTALHWGDAFLDALRPDFQLITYDHRGVGASSRLEGALTITQLARDAAGLLGALEVAQAHVLGISMGGMVAQELALAHPGQVRTLTLGCTYCGGPGSSLADPQVWRDLAEAMMSGDRERALRAAFAANVSAEMAADQAAFARFRAIAARRAVAVPVIMAQLRACAAHDTYARLPRLQMPTLVVHGTVDRIIPFSNGELIASRIAGSRLEPLEGIGHLFFWEQPEHSAELLCAHALQPA